VGAEGREKKLSRKGFGEYFLHFSSASRALIDAEESPATEKAIIAIANPSTSHEVSMDSAAVPPAATNCQHSPLVLERGFKIPFFLAAYYTKNWYHATFLREW
jgi:hypothetical protein